MQPVPLEPTFIEKVWGTTRLAPWFPDSDFKVGEVWFPAEEILAKFIFTSGRLSVQVHPPSKTEMWHILRAGPGASIAVGLRYRVSAAQLRQAALSGEIERLLEWFPVSAGDAFLVPAGTIHAIGADIVLCEIQQNSQVTYRLYDYGRPRQLHIDQAIDVACREPHPGKAVPVVLPNGGQRLVSCEHFITEVFTCTKPKNFSSFPDRYQLLVIEEGQGSLAGEPFSSGQLWRVPASSEPFTIEPDGPVKVLRTYLPAV